MNNAQFEKGMRVKVFDPRLYKNDVITPLSVTIKSATIVRGNYVDPIYSKEEMVDVVFDWDGKESRGHFVWGINK